MNFQQSYREATVQGANPVALVVRLYEQMIADMRQVALAIERNDIPRRSDRIRHVLLVIAHLQSTLDFAQGGKVALDLDNFYNALRQNVVWVQFHPSKRAATQVITDLLAVREAWVQVERHEVGQNEVERNGVGRGEVGRPVNRSLIAPSRSPSPDAHSYRPHSDSSGSAVAQDEDVLRHDRPRMDWQG